MRALIIATAVLIPLSSPVSAQTERPALWDGIYVGIQAGRSTGQATVHYPSGSDLRTTITGHPVSLQLGYNVRRGDWIYGPELMVSGATTSGTTSCINAAFTCNLQVGGQSHFNGRLGHTFGNALIYGTAGISNSFIQYTAEYTGSNPARAGHKYDNEQYRVRV